MRGMRTSVRASGQGDRTPGVLRRIRLPETTRSRAGDGVPGKLTHQAKRRHIVGGQDVPAGRIEQQDRGPQLRRGFRRLVVVQGNPKEEVGLRQQEQACGGPPNHSTSFRASVHFPRKGPSHLATVTPFWPRQIRPATATQRIARA